MDRNAITGALWRTLGGVVGVALLIGIAVAMSHLVNVTGVTLP